MQEVALEVNPPYSVKIAAGLIDRMAAFIDARKVALVSDANVAPLYADQVARSLEGGGKTVKRYVVPPGGSE